MDLYSNLPALRENQIRLLQVHSMSESRDSIVTCTLTTHDLSGTGPCPDFFALSYTWGPPHPKLKEIRKHPPTEIHRVICNGNEIQVLENLYEFLEYCASCQDENFQGLAWVDALCINQYNVPERSHQVNLMAEIYMAASRVVIWLGVEDLFTESAFGLVNGLALSPVEARMKLSPYQVEAGHIDPFLDLYKWKALVTLFQREWFTRAWIIQEVVLSKTAIVLCGRHSLDWERLAQISHFLAKSEWTIFLKDPTKFDLTCSAPQQGHNTPARLEAAKRTWEAEIDEGLLYALIRARPSRCQDPRDKVYSQLALGKANIFPEYKHSITEVFINATKYIINHSDSLLVLTCVEGKEFQYIPDLPTWVPDWTETRTLGLRITGYRDFNAAGVLPKKFSLSMDGKKHILSIEASKLDDMVQIGDSKSEMLRKFGSSNFWDMISKLGKIYASTGESCGEVVWRTIITNRASTTLDPHVRYPASSIDLEPSFRSWIFWKYATADIEPTVFPTPISRESILPSQSELLEARHKAHHDPAYLTSLTHSASLFDLHFCHSRFLRPFRTRQGYFGVGTQSLCQGDSVWIVPGCCVPLILRQSESTGYYSLVGGAYVHGVMNGEALRHNDFRIDVVSLE